MARREVIREVVAEGLTRPIPPVVPRDVAIPHLAERASVIKGVRRSGKTFRLFQRMGELSLEGVPRDHMLFVDFEDDRLDGVSDNVIGDVVEEYLRALGAVPSEKLYLFFDEVQNVEGWGRPLRRLTQDPRFEICVSGSSAKMLSEDVATEFRGRGISAELQPFSFGEFLRYRAHEPKGIVSPDEARELSLLFEQYLRVGGFPEVQDADVATRITALQDIVWTIAARDLAERHGLPMLGTRKFVQRALRLSGREFSVRKTYNDLHSAQIPLSKADAFSLPEHCEDAYLFFLVSRFGADLTEVTRGKRKLYAIDPGLQFAFGPASSADEGQRLEDAVYLELRRRCLGDRRTGIGFYRTKEGFEVDFAVGDADERSVSELYQVAAHAEETTTFTREVRALSAALDETGLSEGTLLVMSARDVPEPEDARIQVQDAWRWTLQLD